LVSRASNGFAVFSGMTVSFGEIIKKGVAIMLRFPVVKQSVVHIVWFTLSSIV
jgi:hypothetical protein